MSARPGAGAPDRERRSASGRRMQPRSSCSARSSPFSNVTRIGWTASNPRHLSRLVMHGIDAAALHPPAEFA